VKFKIDENLPAEACALLSHAGLDAMTVADQRLTGADDPDLYAICQRERRILITLDVGFANIQAYPPETSAGVIVLRVRQQSRPAVLSVIQPLISLLAQEQIEGRLWIVDEQRIRVRS
jgi:predicted nuclease of predicted toxin-antitoxin system